MNFTDCKNVYLGISEKINGPMKYSLKNRLLFLKNKGLDDKIIISAELRHKNKVAIVDNFNKNETITDCDALITNKSKYLLTLTVADCLPIYFYDKNKKVIALAHAGWRGIVSEISKEVVAKFVQHYNSNLNDIETYIGPHIRECHFEVKNDVAIYFKPSDLITKNKKTYINLSGVIRAQLLELNILDKNIIISRECTYCLTHKYFSYRRDKPEEVEAMLAYISLR